MIPAHQCQIYKFYKQDENGSKQVYYIGKDKSEKPHRINEHLKNSDYIRENFQQIDIHLATMNK